MFQSQQGINMNNLNNLNNLNLKSKNEEDSLKTERTDKGDHNFNSLIFNNCDNKIKNFELLNSIQPGSSVNVAKVNITPRGETQNQLKSQFTPSPKKQQNYFNNNSNANSSNNNLVTTLKKNTSTAIHNPEFNSFKLIEDPKVDAKLPGLRRSMNQQTLSKFTPIISPVRLLHDSTDDTTKDSKNLSHNIINSTVLDYETCQIEEKPKVLQNKFCAGFFVSSIPYTNQKIIEKTEKEQSDCCHTECSLFPAYVPEVIYHFSRLKEKELSFNNEVSFYSYNS